MAAAIIDFDRGTSIGAALYSALQQVRDAVTKLGNVRAAMIQACDGTTNVAAHFAELVALAGYQPAGYATANDAALASFAQVDSLYQILTKPSGQGDAAGAAIAQASGMHGVV